jgi:hypothetical protein
MPPLLIPPVLAWTLGAVGAAALAKLLAREWRRVNAELDARERRRAGRRQQADAAARCQRRVSARSGLTGYQDAAARCLRAAPPKSQRDLAGWPQNKAARNRDPSAAPRQLNTNMLDASHGFSG